MKTLAVLALAVALCACGTLSGVYSDVKAVAGSPDVKADVVALQGEIAKLRADLVAANASEGPDVLALAQSISSGNYIGAVADLVTAAPQLAQSGGVVLADAKAIHATLGKLVSDAESAVRLARAAAKLVPPAAGAPKLVTPIDPAKPVG